MAKQPKQPKETTDLSEGWSLTVRALVSVVIVWHLFVLFISPLSVQPTSELVQNVAQSAYVRWYSDPLYMNHGYHFFGPDPPIGGQIIRYEVRAEDGRTIAEGEFPNLQQQWPRLWYHRHMMLADQAAGMTVFGDPERDRRLMLTAYARHLLQKHDGAEARIENVLHLSLYPADVRGDVNPQRPTDPADPSDPRFYRTLMTVVQRTSDLDIPLLPAAPPRRVPTEEVPIGVGG